MTANRWWVRLFARWQARIDSVKGQIQALSLVVTAFSTFSLLLQDFGYGFLVPYLGGGILIAGPTYAYLFAEGGVWNQVARDRQDLSNNFADPNMRITAELIARGFAPLLQQEIDENTREEIKAELDSAYQEQRDGIEIDD